MTTALIIIYIAVGLLSFLLSIKYLKNVRGEYIDWELLFELLFAFGLLWPVSIVLYALHCFSIGDKILDWINKK